MTLNSKESLKSEARIISYYLINEAPHETEILLYIKAADITQYQVESALDRRIWGISMKYPWTLGIFDAGLALSDPGSIVRRKIFTMLSILEASPWHCQKFLPVSFGKIRLFLIGEKIILSLVKSIVGFATLKTYGVLWR